MEQVESVRTPGGEQVSAPLVGEVALDLKYHLAVVLARAGSVRSQLSLEEPACKDLDALLQASRRAVTLANLLANLDELPGAAPVDDLNRRVLALEGTLRRMMGEDVALQLELHRGRLAVRAHPGQLDLVMLQLALNAREAMPDGGTLHVSTAARLLEGARALRLGLSPGLYVRLVVRDDGRGMNEKTRRRLFKPLPGADGGRSLATVHGIVTQAGGAVRVDSAPGQGATFNVHLPLVGLTPG